MKRKNKSTKVRTLAKRASRSPIAINKFDEVLD